MSARGGGSGRFGRRDFLKAAGTVGVGAAALDGRRLGSLRERRARFEVLDLQRTATHPLDPLTRAEIRTFFEVVGSYDAIPAHAYFPIVTLHEPPKADVLAWSEGSPFPRAGFANVYDHRANRLFEVVVDVRAGRVLSWTERAGMQPAISVTEWDTANAAVRKDRRWQRAIRLRGIDPADVYLDGWALGDLPADGVTPGMRAMRVLSFFRGDMPNPYDRPIEGVVATVDMNREIVVDLLDTGVRPVNTTISGSAAPDRHGLRPLVVSQPDGPSFRIDGRQVRWLGWTFRVGYSPREGLILHQIGHRDGDRVRPIIYRMCLDDIYVPYALPDVKWEWRNAMDIAEYNIGQYVEPLRPGVDVPDNAVFFDEYLAGDRSVHGSYALPNAVAIYERDAGSLWDRTDPASYDRDARFARELVVTASNVIGNYTYITEYVFRMDGGIDVRVGATGTLLTRGVDSVAEGDDHGTWVAPHIGAPIHQHFFNFRIDFDVDGTANRLVEQDIRPESSPAGNAFAIERTMVETEQARDADPSRQRRWMIEGLDAGPDGRVGAYMLMPGDTMPAYSSPDFPPLHHAPFAQHALWVSRYRDGELYASGDYPNQGEPGQGLPEYTAAGESVDGEDLVVWHTVGMVHQPMPEHYPVMTTHRVGFSLQPSGFFSRNPALDAPKHT